MQYLKRNTKFSILAFLVLILSITISIFTLAKVNFLPTFPTYPKPEVQTININTASQGEFIKIFKHKRYKMCFDYVNRLAPEE